MLTYLGAAIIFILILFVVERSYRIFSLQKKMSSLNKTVTHLKNDKKNFVKRIAEIHHPTPPAFLDSLTGLINEQGFDDRFSYLLSEGKRFNHLFAVMLVNIDEFSKINQNYSYEDGDKILIQIAERLKKTVRQVDTICRLSGDFVILFPNVLSPEIIVFAAQRILDNIAESPFAVNDKKINITVSIGITVYPYDGTDKKVLLAHAQDALGTAQRNGKNLFQFYQKESQVLGKRGISIKKFLKNEDFINNIAIEFQCYLNILTNETICMEVLVWLNHKSLGKVNLSQFFEIAKNVGKLYELSEWIIKKAVASYQTISPNARPNFLMFQLPLNQLEDFTFVNKLMSQLEDAKIKSTDVVIEIPDEDIENIDLATLRKSLERLHASGFKIAVGILLLGHFAMKKLTDLPVSFLRLDSEFIKGLYLHDESKAILGKMLTLANILGVGILSSGVENVEQKKILEDLGCYIMQGPLFTDTYQVHCPQMIKLEH